MLCSVVLLYRDSGSIWQVLWMTFELYLLPHIWGGGVKTNAKFLMSGGDYHTYIYPGTLLVNMNTWGVWSWKGV